MTPGIRELETGIIEDNTWDPVKATKNRGWRHLMDNSTGPALSYDDHQDPSGTPQYCKPSRPCPPCQTTVVHVFESMFLFTKKLKDPLKPRQIREQLRNRGPCC